MRCLSILFFASLCVALARADYSESMLTGLKGLGLEVRPINLQSDMFEISAYDVEKHVIEKMEYLGVRFLSSIELDLMPGQPFLEVSIDIAHAQGPSHLYVVQIQLKEMAELKRPTDRIVTVAVGTWERKFLGVANRTEAIYENLDKLLRQFADELSGAQ